MFWRVILSKIFLQKYSYNLSWLLLQKRTIEAGTTTACYFASLYTEASAILAKKVAELGQRAFIGKINMNTQRSDGYYESTEKSIKDTMAFIESVEQIGVNTFIFYFQYIVRRENNFRIFYRWKFLHHNYMKYIYCISQIVVESACETNYYTKICIELQHGINARVSKDC